MDTCVLLPEEFSLVLTLHPSPDNVMEMKVDLWSNTTLPAGTSFYPDQGRLKLDKLEVYSFLEETDVRNQYGCEDSVSRIDTRDVRHCNWVRFLNHSTNISEVNLVGVKVKGETVFQTVRTILPNEEIVAYLQPRDEVEQEMDTIENHVVDLLTPDLSIVKKEFDVTPLSPASNPVTRDLLTSPTTTRDDDCKSRVSDMTHSGDEIEKQTQGYSPHSPSTPETERYSDSGTSPLSSGEDLPLNLTSPKTPCSTLSGLTSQVGVYHTPLDKTSPSTSSTSPLSAQSPLTPPLMSRFDISPSFPRQLTVDKPKRNRERTWLPCDVCGKKFDRPSLLKRHMRTHTGEKPHACDVCDKAFSTSSSLNTHRRIHSGEKPHQCQVCGKRFTASSNLYYHRMTHNKDKPHKCTMCDKSFPTPGDLRSHMYVHSGTWPFRCDVCNRGFSKQTNLKNHLLLHSGDKPHECPVCQKKFAIPCNLRTHMKTHEEDDQGSCVTCGRTYLKKETSTSGQCSDCIRASSPGSPSPTQRHVSDFSISKLTNTDEKREVTRSMKSPTYDPRLLLQSMYNPMQFMSPTAAPFITRQHSPIGCLPMYGAHSFPSTDSNQRLVRGLNNVLPLPATVYQSRAQLSATAQGWPGLMAK